MQRGNLFDFHAVALATSLLLFMFYYFLVKKYCVSLLFFILSILSKEQVALTTAFFGLYILITQKKTQKNFRFSLIIIGASAIWFILSMFIIIPYFRNDSHFALSYYTDIRNSLIRSDTISYFVYLLGPLGFISLLSPFYLLIVIPELAINLFSSNINMRNIFYHYASVIQPFVFIAAIYGVNKIIYVKNTSRKIKLIIIIIVFSSLIFSYFKSPLPYSREAELHPFKYPQLPYKEVAFWSNVLKDDSIKIAATGHEAPFFSSRRYYYDFSQYYPLADYIIIHQTEIYNYPEKDVLIPVYERLIKDNRFRLIYNNKGLEVYKKI